MPELTEEDIKNMSPEELRALQKEQCVFCKMVEGKIQARKVFEDENFLAVLDINPATPGHILLMPKEHISILPQLPEPLVQKLGVLSKHLSQAALKAMKAEGTTIFVANGLVAGQRAAHFLLHIIPRKDGDDAGITLEETDISEGDAQKLQDSLLPFVHRVFGSQKAPTSPATPHSPSAPPAKPSSPTQQKPAEKPKKMTNLDEVTEFLTK